MKTADAVMFAIEGGLKLHGAIRKAYVDGTRGRPLVLPLPRSGGIDFTSAHTFFTGDGRAFAEAYPRVSELIAMDRLSNAQETELLELYRAIISVELPGDSENDPTRGLISGEELRALVTVRQWREGRYGPHPTALQQIAGTIVNLAIDYFLSDPGAISDRRPEGRALRAFLSIMDKTDFATVAVTDIVPDLLVAVLDSVALVPELFPGDDKEQLLLQNVIRTLADSARIHLADAPARERLEASAWIQLLARSLIIGGAGPVLDNPHRFFTVGDAEADLIAQVGRSMSDLLLGEDKVTLRPLLSSEGLDTLVKSALTAVADNPDLLKSDSQGLKNVVGAVANHLAKMKAPLSKDVFPELMRLIFEKSAANMDLLWGKRFSKPDKHLLVTAARTLLSELAKPPAPGARWKPRFTRHQVLTLLETVFDEVIDNPQWLILEAGRSGTLLKTVVEAVMASLQKLDGDLVSAETGILVLRVAIEAVARQPLLMEDLGAAGTAEAQKGLTAALDAVFATVFDPQAAPQGRWKLARNSALLALVEAGLQELAEREIGEAHIEALREAVRESLSDAGPFRIDAFVDRLRQKLNPIA